MFTPSGFAHIGSLRGPLVHDIVYRALKDAGVEANFTYVFNDFDPIDGLAPELTKNFSKYLGFSLRTAPSPNGKAASFAHYYSDDFKTVLTSLGVGASYLSSWDMYHEGKFNGVIRKALDNAEKIQDIYQHVSGSKKREKGWLPLQVICEKCGKLGTTRVHKWDGKDVEYICETNMVKWAVGCGYKGKISPFDGHGKLPWKVDWPAHWKVLGVTIEGAGKDHSSAGGSRDIARALCEQVFHIPDPFNLPYEFFLIGGKKMSSSKGLGLKARDLTSLLPPSIGRFLFTRTDYKQAIEIDPVETMAIPDLFDEYDRCWNAYISDSDVQLSRAFILSQVEVLPEKKDLFIPRFRDVAKYLQNTDVSLNKVFEKILNRRLKETEDTILKERQLYAMKWVGSYAPDEYKLQMRESIPADIELTSKQKQYLNGVAETLENNDSLTPNDLLSELFRLSGEINIPSLEGFQAIYLSFIGKKYGPRAAWFLLQYPKEKVIKRLKDVVNSSSNLSELRSSQKDQAMELKTVSRPDLFAINQEVKKIYPTVFIGLAIIKGINVAGENSGLEKEKKLFLDSLSGLTKDQIGKFPEILSYRKLYKDMGVDWHSRRPSPEALLRRVVLGKGLYTVNTCVDAYNLIVMKHRVSVGAFDMDQIKFPTVLRFAKDGDEILLLGDKVPTKYTAKEIAYYDQIGGYNIDFNYRDAQRSMVTQNSKNIWINVDGVFDITPEQVYLSLHESVELIVKYCGGTVELEGVVI